MMKTKTRANLLLLLTAMIWGCAFAAQDVAADVLKPMSFNGSRMLLAALTLVPLVCFTDRRAMRSGTGMAWKQMDQAQRKTLVVGGVCCGVMLALGSIFQQIGLTLGTGAGKAGFITALYIVLVPLTGLFIGKKLGKHPGDINRTSARDLGRMMDMAVRGELFSADVSRKTLQVLAGQSLSNFGVLIPRVDFKHPRNPLPAVPEGCVMVASKSGGLRDRGISHDAGAFFLPDGSNFVLAVTTQSKNTVMAKMRQAEIARAMYDALK